MALSNRSNLWVRRRLAHQRYDDGARRRSASAPSCPYRYVRLFDAYGAGFFYFPGTDTCLKVGGLALTEVRSYDAGYSISGSAFQGNGVTALGAALPTSAAVHSGGGATSVGFVPTPSQYNNARQRDNYGWNSLGRIALDCPHRIALGRICALSSASTPTLAPATRRRAP